MRISDWSSDVCSSDLLSLQRVRRRTVTEYLRLGFPEGHTNLADCLHAASGGISQGGRGVDQSMGGVADGKELHVESFAQAPPRAHAGRHATVIAIGRAEERRVGKEWVLTLRSRGRQYT